MVWPVEHTLRRVPAGRAFGIVALLRLRCADAPQVLLRADEDVAAADGVRRIRESAVERVHAHEFKLRAGLEDDGFAGLVQAEDVAVHQDHRGPRRAGAGWHTSHKDTSVRP